MLDKYNLFVTILIRKIILYMICFIIETRWFVGKYNSCDFLRQTPLKHKHFNHFQVSIFMHSFGMSDA